MFYCPLKNGCLQCYILKANMHVCLTSKELFYLEIILNIKKIKIQKYKKSKYETELYWNVHHALIIHRKVLIWLYIPLAFTLVNICPFPSSATWTWISNSKSYRTYFFIKEKLKINKEFQNMQLCKLQKGCTRLASAKVYQLLAHGRWFSPGIPASSATKTGRHDIAEMLLKVALNTINQSINTCIFYHLI